VLTVAGLASPVDATTLLELLDYKRPTRGCCNDWVNHLRASGFTVKTTEVAHRAPIRQRFDAPDRRAACSTPQ